MELHADVLRPANLPADARTPVIMVVSPYLNHSGMTILDYDPTRSGPQAYYTELNQIGGPTIFYYGTYMQAGYFLTGENAGYNRQTGVLDYNCKPYAPFFGTGPQYGLCGSGAWEVAVRWTYLNVSATPTTVVGPTPGSTPPIPNAGVLNESTVALNWYWNAYTRVQFNWIHSMLDYNNFGFRSLDTFGSRFQIEF